MQKKVQDNESTHSL